MKCAWPGIVLLHAQRGLHQIVEHFGLGAADERRQVEVHHQRVGLAAAVDDVEDLLGDARRLPAAACRPGSRPDW